MNKVWEEEDSAYSPGLRNNTRKKPAKFCLAIVGPGGIGKTAVLKISEALTMFSAGPDAVNKNGSIQCSSASLGWRHNPRFVQASFWEPRIVLQAWPPDKT